MSGIPSPCPREDDYLWRVRNRQRNWLNASFVVTRNIWQRAIDDKLLGYIYARTLGVRTPSVLFCDPRGPMFLPDEWPESWGCCFAIKPLYGYNDFGVMLVEHGIDRFTGAVLRGRDDVIALLRRQGTVAMPRVTIYIETLIRPEAAYYAPNATPTDFKFIMFGDTVASVAIVTARKTSEACMAWVDAAYKRTDRYGCVCRTVDAYSPCAYKHCDMRTPPKPTQWDAMVQAAQKLGKAVGVHMRVDMFAGRTGVPVLGEFTPWHANGKMHCDFKPLKPGSGPPPRGALVRKDGLTGQRQRVDICWLGRLWRQAGVEEGGVIDATTPRVLLGWPQLMYNERANAARVRQREHAAKLLAIREAHARESAQREMPLG